MRTLRLIGDYLVIRLLLLCSSMRIYRAQRASKSIRSRVGTSLAWSSGQFSISVAARLITAEPTRAAAFNRLGLVARCRVLSFPALAIRWGGTLYPAEAVSP